jgi:6-phosphofructokinase 1
MSVLNRESNAPYQVSYDVADISGIANAVKSVPREFINEAGNNVTQEMLDYLSPLIIGEPAIAYKDGLPEYLSLAHLYQ